MRIFKARMLFIRSVWILNHKFKMKTIEMKCTNLLIVIFFLCSLTSFAQEDNAKGKIIFKNLSPTESTTISVDIRKYSENAVGLLKDNLLAYEEKVIEVKYNEKQTHLVFSYNGHMLKEDLIRAFEKNGISYRIPVATASTNELRSTP